MVTTASFHYRDEHRHRMRWRRHFSWTGVSRSGLGDALAYLPVAIALVAAPLPQESLAPLWVSVWLAGLALSAIVGALMAEADSLRRLLPFLLAGVAFLALVAFQTAPFVPAGWAHPVWSELAANGVEGAGARIAADAWRPLEALGLPLAALLGFSAAYLIAWRRGDAWPLVGLLALSAAAYAIGGFAVDQMGPDEPVRAASEPQFDFAGPFSGYHVAATYFGVATLASAALTFRALRDRWLRGRVPLRLVAAVLADVLTSRTVLWVATGIITLFATAMTGSKAGVLATCFAGTALTMALFLRALRSFWARAAITLLHLGVIGLLVATLGSGTIVDRVRNALANDDRFDVWSATAEAIETRPFTGTGLGTFAEVFPAYRSAEIGYGPAWQHARSTPLELALEIGLPAAAIVGLLWLFLFFRQLIPVFFAQRSYVLPALGASVMLLTTLHGMVDASFAEPGFAIPFALLIGATLGHSDRRAAARERNAA